MNAFRVTQALVIRWCEGTKARKDKRWKNAILSPIEVINSNPRLVKIFLDFLRFDLGVNPIKIKGQLQIHQGDNQEELKMFWSTYLSLPQSQFNKTIIRPIGNKLGKNNGTFKLRLYNKKLYHVLEQMLQKNIDIIDYRSGSSSDG